MTPDEIIDRLKRNDAKISRKTLYNWEKFGVISDAVFRNSRTAEYPVNAFSEVYAAYCLTQEGVLDPLFDFRFRINLEAVAKIRKVYQKISMVGAEHSLNPWESDEDLSKVISLISGKTSSVFRLLDLSFSLYWPKTYSHYLKKAEALK